MEVASKFKGVSKLAALSAPATASKAAQTDITGKAGGDDLESF